MALDKQKILSELGSVVNQLQSADCGCMGKLFNNTNAHVPNANTTPGAGDHKHGCCHCHGYNHCGTPCNGDYRCNMTSHYNNACMGRCNPTKLYTDTYQYLNQNLMQPVVKEVYNDLKSLTPANTVMSNQPNAHTPSQGQTNLPDNGMNVNSQGMHMDPRMGGDQLNAGGYMNATGSHVNGVGGYLGGAGGNVNTMNYNMSGTTGNMPGMGGHMGESTNQLAGTVNQMPGTGGPFHGSSGHGGGTGGYMSGVGGQAYEVGQNIVNMMMGGNKSKANENATEGGVQLTQPMVIDAPQSPHGQVGLIPLTPQTNENRGNVTQMQSINQYADYNQGNTYGQMPVLNTTQLPNGDTNPLQQIATKPQAYGKHAPGITKFNEMFPGVMQNFGGDLGFDPMAIAVQMNPANQQRAAIDTMTKLLNDNKTDINKMPNKFNSLQPPNLGNLQTSNLGNLQPSNLGNIQPSNLGNIQPSNLSNIQPSNLGNLQASNLGNLQTPNLGNLQPNDGVMPSHITANQPQQSNIPNQINNNQIPVTNQQMVQNQRQVNYAYSKDTAPYQQQIYTAATPTPPINQQQLQQPQHYNVQDQQLIQQQYLSVDPNNASINPQNYGENVSNYGMQSQMLNSQLIPERVTAPPQMEKEPIYPANSSPNQTYTNIKRHVNYTYNTLGQPVEMLPAKRYHTKDPGGPQTLYPQDIPVNTRHPKVYTNVKSTVSKTSIMGNQPLGRNPSRSQLQHIYHQYGGSQSLTKQNIASHNQRPTYSEARLNISQQREARAMPNEQILVEKFGGDTLQNNDANNNIKKPEPASGQIGDAPDTNKNHSNEVPEPTTMKNPKARNGLQDVVYTSYPTSTAWSFHGNARPSFLSRLRSRV